MSQIKSVICRILRSFRFLALFLIYLSNSCVCVIYDIVTLFIKGRYTTTTTTTTATTTTTTTNNNNNNDNNNNNITLILMKEVLQCHMSYRLFTPHQ